MLTSLKNCLIVLAVFAADILAGVFLPLTTCTIASIFDTSAPVIYRDIYIKDDVAQLLLSIIFLVQLQFVYTYCIHSFVILKLHSFQLQAIILECLFIINFIRGCALLTFVVAAARSGNILKPLFTLFHGSAGIVEPSSEGLLSMLVWTGSRSDEEDTDAKLLHSISKTPLGYFVVSYLYIILHYFSLQNLEETIILDQVAFEYQENVRNNNIRPFL
ncbi:unnamed protein product [Allacma fusca]|uniref:Uncharacterized protein n=1 Tax=Allacma fusca TaxID=39272 RepID=A0A8J2PP39_9HEXA|nr:unnamed protein product [Allacma fusca]